MRYTLVALITLLTISSISSNAQKFEWVRTAGNIGEEKTIATCIDQAGNVYSIGSFRNAVDFDPGPGVYQLNGGGSTNVFILKHAPSGSLIWAKEINAYNDMSGGLHDVSAYSMVIDDNADLIITGSFIGGVDFDPGSGMDSLVSFGAPTIYCDIFVLKLDSAGNHQLALQIGDVDNDSGQKIALDAAGNICVIGLFHGSVDFDPGPGTQIFTANTNLGHDCFIIKLDPIGNLIWAKQIGSLTAGGNMWIPSIAVDNQDNVCISGTFSGLFDFDPGPGNNNINSSGSDIFIGKYDMNGNFLWTNTIGELVASQHGSNSVTTDASGNVYLSGYFYDSLDIDPTPAQQFITGQGYRDFFIEKFSPNGTYIWAKPVSGIGHDDIVETIVDNDGNLLCVGLFYGAVDFNPDINTHILTGTGSPSANNVNAFILKLTPDAQLMWVKHLRGTEAGTVANLSSSIARAIAVDNQDNLYVVGDFVGTVDFDFNEDSTGFTSAGWSANNVGDAYILKISQNCAAANHCNEIGQSYTCYADYPYIDAPASACMLSNNGCSDAPDAWGFCRYNATSWVGWSVNKDMGTGDTLGVNAHFFNNDMVDNIAVPGNLGSAVNWKDKLEFTPFGYLVDTNPAAGSIAWWGDHTGDGSGIGTDGHVAYVSCVNGDSVTLTEYSFGTTCFYNVRYIDNSQPFAAGNWKPDFYIHIELPMSTVTSTLQNADFKVYPNPANSNINVTLDKGYANDGTLTIYDVVGKEISRQTLTNKSNYSFDLSGLSNGLYFIQLSTGNKISNQKFELIR